MAESIPRVDFIERSGGTFGVGTCPTAAEPASTKWGDKKRGGCEAPGKIFGTMPFRTLGNAHFKYRNAPILI